MQEVDSKPVALSHIEKTSQIVILDLLKSDRVVKCMMVTSAARSLKGDQLIQALRQVNENLEPLMFELSKY